MIHHVNITPNSIRAKGHHFTKRFMNRPPKTTPPINTPTQNTKYIIRTFINKIIQRVLIINNRFQPRSKASFTAKHNSHHRNHRIKRYKDKQFHHYHHLYIILHRNQQNQRRRRHQYTSRQRRSYRTASFSVRKVVTLSLCLLTNSLLGRAVVQPVR